MKSTINQWIENSHLFGANAPFIESLFEDYCRDPGSISEYWRQYFAHLEQGGTSPPPLQAFTSKSGDRHSPCTPKGMVKQGAVLRLINAHRMRGHQNADLDPINLRARPKVPELEPFFHGLEAADMGQFFDTGSLVGADRLTLEEILANVRQRYCSSIGSEYMHIIDTEQKRWIQQRLEPQPTPLSADELLRIHERITAAEGMERYLHNRYVGQKRFSLEGGEALIPLLDELVQRSGSVGIEEMVIGMAHRGRLNVLINLLGKSPMELTREFEGTKTPIGAGDVKYHLGYSSNISTPGHPLHLVLAFNPSHLEIVSPVVQGSVRARQQRYNDKIGDQVIPVIIHGDSAFAGQGVVMETLQMSQSRGYTTGGTVHIVINNQIGFTTSNPLDTRSTLYCTDVAKMVQAPIFHVNGDDPEAVIFVTRLALDFRQAFHKDVIIDLICYRRHGHNEADEPSATQPMMYQRIQQRPTLRELFAKRLDAQGICSLAESQKMQQLYRDRIDQGEIVAPNIMSEQLETPFRVNWHPYQGQVWDQAVDTKVTLERLRGVADSLQQLPPGFELHPRVAKIIDDRRKMAAGALPFDWGGAEILAYGTLVMEGYEIRLSGQDSGRGTFFHRHAVLHNQKNGESYTPLQQMAAEQPHFLVIDSLLSEEAVLGFEYGYATAEPRGLVIWEAQFGDFANGAQVVIDQFISSGEAKWGRLCGLTLFLPHGYEGQGAEHSSARLERYLQLCAEHNIQVCVPSTPAQLYHMIRRQMVRPYRKPLVVMMPKSLLRHKRSVSSLEDLYQGRFYSVIDEQSPLKPQKVKRILLCSGKLYFDLLAKREELIRDDVVIIRIEQLYPFPLDDLKDIFARYTHANEVVWCQEEPMNQGVWFSSQHHMRSLLSKDQQLYYIGRDLSAAPAVGSFKLHIAQQNRVVESAFAPLTKD